MKRGLPAVREQVAKLEHENAKLKRALGDIAHYMAEEWTGWDSDYHALWMLLDASGFEATTQEGEPEPFIHGDSAEGAEG